jgi:hypothetical protein
MASIAFFHKLPEGISVYPINIHLNHYKIPLNHYKIPLKHYKIPLNHYKIPLNTWYLLNDHISNREHDDSPMDQKSRGLIFSPSSTWAQRGKVSEISCATVHLCQLWFTMVYGRCINKYCKYIYIYLCLYRCIVIGRSKISDVDKMSKMMLL